MNLQISFYATFFLYIAIIVQWHTIHRCSGWCHRHHLAAVASSKLIFMSGVATAAAKHYFHCYCCFWEDNGRQG